ncbi:helix-turn-helix domain-containing protein [Prolixibacter denitrificans]|uniref:AraC family transcriptional regulator n=1 Tax=Prolixibacter denitrificans TaxID=1541063 RepID=A0A2P8CHD0_9BACT|nr:helix-turn-helix domain-containing protein [Prolixibacter denitrificans]PSK84390.1 AraC-like DNA-binding protein [Prolixibacter denitrificans]GET20564.1 AraC family transcriptional regulator [Prolixibacter denitrificans]
MVIPAIQRRDAHKGWTNDQWFFKLMTICDYKTENQSEVFHLHDYYSVFWIKTGEVVHATDFVEYTLKGNSILFVPPGIRHRMILDKYCDGVTFIFNEEFIRMNFDSNIPVHQYEIFFNHTFKSMVTLTDDDIPAFEMIVEKLMKEYNRHDKFSRSIILNLLNLFFLEASRIYEQQSQEEEVEPGDAPNSSIIEFKSLIDKHYREEKGVAFYAEKLNMQPSCLNNVTRRTTGITAGEMIRNRIITEVKRLLFSTDMSIKEIGIEMGFDDPAYFSRFFKKYTGTSLSDFRERSRKKYK